MANRLTLALAEPDKRLHQRQVLDRQRSSLVNLSSRVRRGVEDLQDEVAWEAGWDRLYHGWW